MTDTETRNCKLTRRRVLGHGAAGAGLAMVPWHWALADQRKKSSGSIRERAIPASGEQVPVMGMGSSGSFGYLDASETATMRTVMKKCVALGGELVDTSPTYGNAETHIGDIAETTGVRDQLFMATKVHISGKQAGLDQMRRSAEKLGRPIDLMQIHNFVDLETQWDNLQQLKADGAVRYIGITHYLTSAFERLEAQMKVKDMDFVQFNYSIMTPQAEQRLLPLAADRGIAVLVNRAFNDGRFFSRVEGHTLPDYAAEFDCESWAQFALKYVLANQAVTAAIPATGDPGHLVDNMQAGYGALPDQTMCKRMRETIAAL